MSGQLDDLLTQLGTGRWNLFHILALSYWFSLPSYHTLGGAFLAPKVDYTCVPKLSDALNTATDNSTEFSSITSKYFNVSEDSCTYTTTSTSEGKTETENVKCTEWDFKNSTFSNTVTSQFELVCSHEYLRATYQSIYMFGIFVGAPLNGLLADRYGRLPMISISSVLYSLMAIGSCWIPNLSLLLLMRFLLGLMHPTSLQTGYILAMEVTEPKLRSVMGIMLFLPWALGTMAWGGFAYLIRDWQWLQLTVSLPCFLFLPALWFLDESPRWLVVQGKYGQALKVIKKAASWNRASIPSDEKILQMLKRENRDVQRTQHDDVADRSFKQKVNGCLHKLCILFRSPRLRVITIAMYIDYLIVGMVYFGLSLSGGNFSSDPFLYMTLTGLAEIPGNTVVILPVKLWGRRNPTIGFFFLSGVALLALPFITAEHQWAVVGLALVGKMSIASVFNIIFLYATELFPTEVRTRGMGTSLMMSRVGSMISPFITQYLGAVYPWAPSVLFGASSVVAGLATMILPETSGIKLPETVDHLEQTHTRSTSCPCTPVKIATINAKEEEEEEDAIL